MPRNQKWPATVGHEIPVVRRVQMRLLSLPRTTHSDAGPMWTAGDVIGRALVVFD